MAWKREHNIRQREAAWKRRQDDLLTQKQVAWQIESCERENRIAAARETRRRAELQKRVTQRHSIIDQRYKERCRDTSINKREEAWEQQENAKLVRQNREAQEIEQKKEEELAARKVEKYEELKRDAEDRALMKQKQQDINNRREENIRLKEEQRRKSAAEQAARLKVDSIAKSHDTVKSFADRTTPQTSELVGVMTQLPANKNFGGGF